MAATELRPNEIDLDQLLAKAEAVVDDALTEGHALAQRIVTEAEIEGERIVIAARNEAQKRLAEGRRLASGHLEVLEALRANVGEFGRMNIALVQELSALGGTFVTRDLRSQG